MSKRYVQDRDKTDPTAEVLLRLVYAVRDQLYRPDQKPTFYAQLKDVKRALAWPASWFNERAIFVSAERYTQVIMARLIEIKRHGDTAGVQYWPRYILTCLQRHFRIEGEDYYDEGKAARDIVSRVVPKLQSTAPAPDTFTRQLAAAHALLKSPGGRSKHPKRPPAAVQKELF